MTDAILSFCPELAPVLEAGRRLYSSISLRGCPPLALEIGHVPSTGSVMLLLKHSRCAGTELTRSEEPKDLELRRRDITSKDPDAFDALKNALKKCDLKTPEIWTIEFAPCLDIVAVDSGPEGQYTLLTRAIGSGSYGMTWRIKELLPKFRQLGLELRHGERQPIIFDRSLLEKASAHERLSVETAQAGIKAPPISLAKAVKHSFGHGLWLRRDGDIVLVAAQRDLDTSEIEILGAIDLRETT